MCLTQLKNMSSSMLLVTLTLISIGVLGAAYILEHYFGIHPCQMCRYEQQVFMAAGTLSFLSFLLLPKGFHSYAFVTLGIIFMGGTLLAAYHVAIQHHWVSLPTFCSTQDFSAFDSVEDLKAQMMKTPFVRCDQVTWSLFGLSLAAYNGIISLLLTLLCWSQVCKQK